jgi:hypothetical protein
MESMLEMIEEMYPEALKMDGYDDCIIGVCRRFGSDGVIAYDVEKVLEKLMKDGMTYEEAREFFEYNQIGAWVGEKTPVFIERFRG